MKRLETLRREIDQIDREILSLLNRRAELAKEVGEIKKREGLPFYVPGREAKILAKLEELNRGPLPPESIRAIFR